MTEGTSLNTKDLLVYLALKSFNNARNQCYPSLNTIAKKLGTSINTVSKCIDNLIKEGYVSRESSGRGFNYTFTETDDFEPFAHNFIERTDYTFKEKAYLAGM
jgi:DNA-binding MarR family transcriptional regulator